MTIEEKAKRYDEALEIAKKINNEQRAQPFNVMTRVFPELKESEDNKVRKKLIHLVKKSHEQGGYALHKGESDEMLAWLEKKGEQKAAEKLSKDQEYTLNRIVEYLEDNDCSEDWKDLLMGIHDTPYIKQKPADCSCVPLREMVLNVWELGNIWKELTSGSIITEHGTQLDYIIKHWSEGDYYEKIEQKPATMSLDEAIEHCKEKSCVNSACALEHKQLEKWLTELKELKEQKPAWSEEDERYLSYAIHAVEDMLGNNGKNTVTWLKSIKERIQPQQKQE